MIGKSMVYAILHHCLFWLVMMFPLATLGQYFHSSDVGESGGVFIDKAQLLFDEECPDTSLSRTTTTESDKEFSSLLCVMHRRSLRELGKQSFEGTIKSSSNEQSSLEDLQVLNNALQLKGQQPDRQAFLEIMEGITYCRMSELSSQQIQLMGREGYDGSQGIFNLKLAKSRFCSARRGAMAAFSKVNLGQIKFDYEESMAVSVNKIINDIKYCRSGSSNIRRGSNYFFEKQSMNGGLGGYFLERDDLDCGSVNKSTGVQARKISATEANNVVEKLIKGPESPLGAIFQRKNRVAKSILVSAEKDLQILKGNSVRIDGVLTITNDHYKTKIKSDIESALKNYQTAYSVTTAVDDLSDRWLGGLLIDSNDPSRDLESEVKGDNVSSSGGFARVKNIESSLTTLNKKIKEVTSGLENSSKKNEDIREKLGQLCAHFFCDINVPISERINLRNEACKEPGLSGGNNPLCDQSISGIKIGNRLLTDFCIENGNFESKYTKTNLLNSDALACLKEYR
jgi:hypothetical protein